MSTIVPYGEHPEDKYIDLRFLKYLQTLTMAQRVERHDGAIALIRGLREAGRRQFERPEDTDA